MSFPEPGRDLRGHGAWPLRFRGGEDERWAVEWLRYRTVRVRKALRCRLAPPPPPKVIQLISVIECASLSAAMPS